MPFPLLNPPFPWYGGKRRVASIVWKRFGPVDNYIEPFFGSGAVLLRRPWPAKIETINDKDCYVANFWRAIKSNPKKVAKFADWPVNEADLHARNRWLNNQDKFISRMNTDPNFYDTKIAGWWVWGQSMWIGAGWCNGTDTASRPYLSSAGQGVHVVSDLTSYFDSLAKRLRKVRVVCGDWKRVVTKTPLLTDKGFDVGVFLDPPYSPKAERRYRKRC